MNPDDSMSDSGSETEEIAYDGELDDASEQINSRCSVKKMYWMMHKFGEEKRGLVSEMGFRGFLDMQLVTRSNRGFSMWLLEHVDEQASAIVNGHLRHIPFFPEDFGKALGIPFGGSPIGVEPGSDAVTAVRKLLRIGDSVKQIKSIEEIVNEEYPNGMNKRQKNRFKVAFAICAVTHMLSPMLKGNYFQTFYWGALQNPDLIPMYDWGSLVRDGILSSARLVKAELQGTVKKNKKTNISGCTHGLQVFYIDNLDLGSDNLNHKVFPRMKVYSEKVINKIITADLVSGKHADVIVYGRLLPRSDAAVCYGRRRSPLLGRQGLTFSTEEIVASDPLIEKISSMLLDKVAKFSATCKDAVYRASVRVKEMNRLHAEEWASLAEDTNLIISSETAVMMGEINRVKSVLGRRRKEDRADDAGPSAQYPTNEARRDEGFRSHKDIGEGGSGANQGGHDTHTVDSCGGNRQSDSGCTKERDVGGRCTSDGYNPVELPELIVGGNKSLDVSAATVPVSTTRPSMGDASALEHVDIVRGGTVQKGVSNDDRQPGKRRRVKRVISRGNTPKRSNWSDDMKTSDNDDQDTAVENLDSLINAIAEEHGQFSKNSRTPDGKRNATIQEDPEAKRRRMLINTLEVPSMELFCADDISPPVQEPKGSLKAIVEFGVDIKKEGANINIHQGVVTRGSSPEHREMPLSVVPHGAERTSVKGSSHGQYHVSESAFRKKDLMAEFCDASSSQGTRSSGYEGDRYVIDIPDDPEPLTGLELVFTQTPPAIGSSGVADKSPVSRNREVAALELDYREEMETTTLNLNLKDGDDSLSAQPITWRRVKPGPCAKSPFVLGYDPPLRAHSGVVKFYNAFFREKAETLRNNWIISSQPKYIEINGDLLKSMLREKGSLETEFVNLAMRRYQQLDIAFSAEKNEGCWRIFLEADFANHVFRGDVVTGVRYIYDLFRGPLVTFDVHLCTEIILPVRFEASWSTYIWDFHDERITVLDPTMDNGESSDKEKQARHSSIAAELHRAIGQCIAVFFKGWEPNMKDWPVHFPRGLTLSPCDSNDSGIYALHFARNWTGKRLKKMLSSNGDGLLDSRRILLVDMLAIEGNIGHIPAKYRKSLVPVGKVDAL